MRGRTPVGPELADRLAGSELARHRMYVILQTLTGEMRVKDACEELEICPQRFEALRAEAITAGIAALELKPAGRPPAVREGTSEEVAGLKARVRRLEGELEAALVRAELAEARSDRGVAKKSRPRSSRVKESSRLRPGTTTKNQSH